jgi:uncharacterized C2H2 Zn-finger protein
MKLAAIAILAGLGAAAFGLQERERPVTNEERTRFLFHAIYEGLIEDGAQLASVKAILDKRNEWFIARCPVCDSVFAAFQAYFMYSENHGWKTDRADGLPDWFGRGWSKETVADLKHPEVKRRHAALKGIVEKYVARRFETVKMTDARRDRMQESLKIGMKEGLGFLKDSGGEDLFPSSCPSCEGAN